MHIKSFIFMYAYIFMYMCVSAIYRESRKYSEMLHIEDNVHAQCWEAKQSGQIRENMKTKKIVTDNNKP